MKTHTERGGGGGGEKDRAREREIGKKEYKNKSGKIFKDKTKNLTQCQSGSFSTEVHEVHFHRKFFNNSDYLIDFIYCLWRRQMIKFCEVKQKYSILKTKIAAPL